MVKNKNVNEYDLKDYFNDSNKFKNEKEMCNYIADNIDKFCKDVLNVEYEECLREWYFTPVGARRLSGNKPHIDIAVKCKDGEYVLIECKNPRHDYKENINAIGQLLDYIRIAEDNGYKIKDSWICTSKHKIGLTYTIKKFNLPINICVLNKNNNAVWKGGEE